MKTKNGLEEAIKDYIKRYKEIFVSDIPSAWHAWMNFGSSRWKTR